MTSPPARATSIKSPPSRPTPPSGTAAKTAGRSTATPPVKPRSGAEVSAKPAPAVPVAPVAPVAPEEQAAPPADNSNGTAEAKPRQLVSGFSRLVGDAQRRASRARDELAAKREAETGWDRAK
eukprot:3853119-Prymnesium_polylepis.1